MERYQMGVGIEMRVGGNAGQQYVEGQRMWMVRLPAGKELQQAHWRLDVTGV